MPPTPNQSPTPFNHDWVSRTSVVLGNESDLGGGWRSEAKLWAAWQRLYQRSAAAGAHPASTTLVDEQFRSEGLDWRFRKRWGRGNALTFGTVLYHDDAPFRQWTSTDILAPRGSHDGTPRLDQSRDAWYGAIFAENVFRLPGRWHVVPSFRLEHEKIEIDESVRPPNLVRPLIHQSASRTIPMLGLGAGFDFGNQNETYFSVSQGYRPVRFFDVASPFSNVNPGGVPAASKSLSWEAGVHGTPIKGLFYDASLFWIDFRNRIETIVISPVESVFQNSGDTRHRGFEGEISYDVLAVAQQRSAPHFVRQRQSARRQVHEEQPREPRRQQAGVRARGHGQIRNHVPRGRTVQRRASPARPSAANISRIRTYRSARRQAPTSFPQKSLPIRCSTCPQTGS